MLTKIDIQTLIFQINSQIALLKTEIQDNNGIIITSIEENLETACLTPHTAEFDSPSVLHMQIFPQIRDQAKILQQMNNGPR